MGDDRVQARSRRRAGAARRLPASSLLLPPPPRPPSPPDRAVVAAQCCSLGVAWGAGGKRLDRDGGQQLRQNIALLRRRLAHKGGTEKHQAETEKRLFFRLKFAEIKDNQSQQCGSPVRHPQTNPIHPGVLHNRQPPAVWFMAVCAESAPVVNPQTHHVGESTIRNRRRGGGGRPAPHRSRPHNPHLHRHVCPPPLVRQSHKSWHGCTANAPSRCPESGDTPTTQLSTSADALVLSTTPSSPTTSSQPISTRSVWRDTQ